MPHEEKNTAIQLSLKTLESIYPKFVECFDFSIEDIAKAMTFSIRAFYPEYIKEERGHHNNFENSSNNIITQHYPKFEEFFFQHDKFVTLKFPSCETFEKVQNFLESYNFDPATENAMWVMFYIYSEQEIIEETSIDWNYENIDWNYYEYKTKIEPDFLKLYDFIKRHEKGQRNEPIRIICGNDNMKLDNHSNWFWIRLKEYLENHLEEESKEHTSEKIKNLKGKAGAKEDRDTNRIIYQLYLFLKDHPRFQGQKKISNSICEFILKALKVIPRHENFPPFTIPVTIEATRTRISDLLKGRNIRSKRNENLSLPNIRFSTDFIQKEYW